MVNGEGTLPCSGYVVQKNEELLSLGEEKYGSIIDLGLGRSPLGPPLEIARILVKLFDFSDGISSEEVCDKLLKMFAEYPRDIHAETCAKVLVHHFGLNIDPGNIVFGRNGSYGLGDDAIRILCVNKLIREVLSLPLSFPNVMQYCRRYRIPYRIMNVGYVEPWKSIAEFGYQNDCLQIENSCVYFDYPNNPTGFTNLECALNAINYVGVNGGIPLVDLAFADVLGTEEMRIVIECVLKNQGIVLGSLSKVYGYPGFRIGWEIMSDKIAQKYILDERLVFSLDELSMAILKILLTRGREESIADRHIKRVAQTVAQINENFYEKLGEIGIQIWPTNLVVPIQVMTNGKSNFDKKVLKQGIRIESLCDYRGTLPASGFDNFDLSKFVRMRTPRDFKEVCGVIKRLSVIDNE